MRCITATNIKYLVVIYQLEKIHQFVKCAEIARALDVSRPTVHSMMSTLSLAGLADKARYGKVTLTPYGRQLAEVYHQSYSVIAGYMLAVCPVQVPVSDSVYEFMARIDADMLAEICEKIKSGQQP